MVPALEVCCVQPVTLLQEADRCLQGVVLEAGVSGEEVEVTCVHYREQLALAVGSYCRP